MQAPCAGLKFPNPLGKECASWAFRRLSTGLVQQAILQALDPVLDPTFSASSFGFRPGRGARDALRRARDYVRGGDAIVVDFDLKKLFDRVNHDIAMARLVRLIADPRLLVIIRRFLQTGMLSGGVIANLIRTTSNAGLPVLPLRRPLEHLCAATASEGVRHGFGYRLAGRQALTSRQSGQERGCTRPGTYLPRPPPDGGRLSEHREQKSMLLMPRLRAITCRNRGISLVAMIAPTNPFTKGWVTTTDTPGLRRFCTRSTAGSGASFAASGSNSASAP